jgi:predicted amidophosphoribosyltransferase
VTNLDALDAVKQSLFDTAGGYLWNTIHLPYQTCSHCRGTFAMRDGHPICGPCTSYLGANVADIIASVIYGVDGEQSAKLMYGYKSTPQSAVLTQRIASLAAVALRGHVDCASKIIGVPCTLWATVPSLRNIGSDHPLRSILLGFARPEAEIKVVATDAAKGKTPQERRIYNPAFYAVETPIPKDAHVMLVDDTWTSGSHVQSVATALKQAGAGKVSILAIARWMDLTDPWTRRVFAESIRPRQYNPHVCPWAGASCPA